MNKYCLQTFDKINGKELYSIYEDCYGDRYVPYVYYSNTGAIEQINIVDMRTMCCVKECYQLRSANTFINKLLTKLNKSAA